MSSIRLTNEFAEVLISLDLTANGPRLCVTDQRTQRSLFLDPLELESLVWCCHSDLKRILDPSLRRWNDDIAALQDLFRKD